MQREDVMPPMESRPCCGLDALELGSGVANGFFPAHFAPVVGDAFADHRLRDPVRVRGIAVRETALHAGMALVRATVAVRHHARHGAVGDLGDERTTHATVSAGGGDRLLRQAGGDDRLLHQCAGGTGFDAGAAGHTLRLEERLLLRGGDARIDAAAFDRQRERALRVFAGAHAARADDAQVVVEAEIRIAGVDRLRRVEVARRRRASAKRDSSMPCAAASVSSSQRLLSGQLPMGCSETYSSSTPRRSLLTASLAVRTFMPAATSVVHEAGNPLRPSISTRQTRQEPKALSVSVAQSFGMSRAGERRRAHDGRARRHRDRRAIDFERDGLRRWQRAFRGRDSSWRTSNASGNPRGNV